MSEKKNKLKEMQETCKLRSSTSVPLSVLKKIGEKIYTGSHRNYFWREVKFSIIIKKERVAKGYPQREGYHKHQTVLKV